jgi:hypothetical protein
MYINDDINFFYYFWNGSGWTNTNHTTGSSTALNPGGTANYIFNLDGINNSLYKYDGTGNGTLLLSNLGINPYAIWDITADKFGNFYVFNCGLNKIRVYNPNGIILDSLTTTSDSILGGGGIAIVGNRLYVITVSDLYVGVKTGNNINFTWLKHFDFIVTDMAACPEAALPLSTAYYPSLQNFSVYPNPFNSALTFQINSYENFEIVIYDIMSKMIIQQQFTEAITLKTDQLSTGMYLYEVRDKNGIVKNGKIIKH